MTRVTLLAIAAVTLALAALLLFLPRTHSVGGDGESGAEAFARGPHGGRLLEDGDFALEVTIFERGVPPELRVYPFRGGKPIAPSDVELSVELHRLGSQLDVIAFRPREDHLVGEREIREPHSFQVRVRARSGGADHEFAYESLEGRVTLSPEVARASGVEIEEAGPRRLRSTLELRGRIAANEDSLAHVLPRFSGVVRAVRKRLGDTVEAGATLAVIESNESLSAYEVRSPIAGTVVFKEVTLGEFVANDRELFTIAELSSVWVDLHVYAHDFGKLRVGQRISVDAGNGQAPAETTLAYLSPIGAENTQTLLARAVLPNPDGAWRPGLFVRATAELDALEAPVAVRASALQRMRERDVVFRNEGDVFEAQPVELGRRDGDWVEIVSGLSPGDRYAAQGSFLLKADVGKSGASHGD